MHETGPADRSGGQGRPGLRKGLCNMADESVSITRRGLKALKRRALSYPVVYNWYHRRKHRSFTGKVPHFAAANRPLRDKTEVETATRLMSEIDLPRHGDETKNWDTMTALTLTLRECPDRNLPVLDAGGMAYSAFLPSLYLYGYRDLTAVNMSFRKPFRQGPIKYIPGDITKLSSSDKHFGAVFCQSVIEHGVQLDSYFREMTRVVRPGGLLVISTDYWEPEMKVDGVPPYGVDVHILCRREIEAAIRLAEDMGWTLTSPAEFDCKDRVVYWERVDLAFTFYTMALRRR